MGRHSGGSQSRSSRTRKFVAASMSSFVAGLGVAAFASSGPQALAQTSVPVISSINVGEEMQTTIPASLTGSVSASSLAALRDAREGAAAVQTNVCAAGESMSTLTAALTDEPEGGLFYPVEQSAYHVSSAYGYRLDPWTRRVQMHLGVDFAAADGTPIHSIADGVVVHAGAGIDGRSSNLVIIEHEINGEKVWSWYVHMWDHGVFVSEGDEVVAGQRIGLVGSKGRATGPHLHFEVHVGEKGNTVNPEAYLAGIQAQNVTELCE